MVLGCGVVALALAGCGGGGPGLPPETLPSPAPWEEQTAPAGARHAPREVAAAVAGWLATAPVSEQWPRQVGAWMTAQQRRWKVTFLPAQQAWAVRLEYYAESSGGRDRRYSATPQAGLETRVVVWVVEDGNLTVRLSLDNGAVFTE